MSKKPLAALRTLLGDLHAERVRSWNPTALQVNIDQRQQLVADFDPLSAVQPGTDIGDFQLLDVDGVVLSREDLLRRGPAVLIFFRFAGCPACNVALPYYERALWPRLRRAGVPLVAISPQLPERLVDIRDRHQLTFTVASDPGNRLAKRLGLTFEANPASRAAMQAKGSALGDVTGTGTWDLPYPAALIVGRDGAVLAAEITPDWMARTEAETILDWAGVTVETALQDGGNELDAGRHRHAAKDYLL